MPWGQPCSNTVHLMYLEVMQGFLLLLEPVENVNEYLEICMVYI